MWLNQGRFADAVWASTRAAERIEPRFSTVRPEQLSVWGSLLLTGLAAAAAGGRVDDARELLSMAGAASARLGADRDDYQTAFGPAQVAMQAVHASVVLGRPGEALAGAARVRREVLPTAAHGRHLLDVAQAEVDVRRDAHALETLLMAERLSPEWMRHQVPARELVRTLAERRRRIPDGLRGLAARLAVNEDGMSQG
ncbi:MAG: hypothetical protein ACRDN9_13685 [Streptosporangiaceae bacterium]